MLLFPTFFIYSSFRSWSSTEHWRAFELLWTVNQQVLCSSLELVHNIVMMNDAIQLRGQDDVCPHIFMVHKSEGWAWVFWEFCQLREVKININGRLSDSILTDLKVLVIDIVRSEYLEPPLSTYWHILIPGKLITFRVLVAPNKFLFWEKIIDKTNQK